LPVRIVAYTLATAISFSRVTTGAHFPSDVFIGAATGFAIARFDVLRHSLYREDLASIPIADS
jgi:hypothetical protein